jgi:hypothetical protein
MGKHLINCTILGKSILEDGFRAGKRILPYYQSGKMNFCLAGRLKICLFAKFDFHR